MGDFTKNVNVNIELLKNRLRVDANFDMLTRRVKIGGRTAGFLVIVGFVGIRDDVREEAKQAIEEVQNAGVQVVMITGDRKETAI